MNLNKSILLVSTILLLPTAGEGADFRLSVQPWIVSKDGTSEQIVGSIPYVFSNGEVDYEITSGNVDEQFEIDSQTGVVRLSRSLEIDKPVSPRCLTIRETDRQAISNDPVFGVFLEHLAEQGVEPDSYRTTSLREFVVCVRFESEAEQKIPEQSIAEQKPAIQAIDKTDAGKPILVELYEDPTEFVGEVEFVNDAELKSQIPLSCGKMATTTHFVGSADHTILSLFSPIPDAESELPIVDDGSHNAKLVIAQMITKDRAQQNAIANHAAVIRKTALIGVCVFAICTVGLMLLYFRKRVRKLNEINKDEQLKNELESLPIFSEERKFLAFKTEEDVQKLRDLLQGSRVIATDPPPFETQTEVLVEQTLSTGSSLSNSLDFSLTQEFSGLASSESLELEYDEYAIDPAKRLLLEQTAEFRLIANTATKYAITTYWTARFNTMLITLMGLCCVGCVALILVVRDFQNVLLCSAWSLVLLSTMVLAAGKLRAYVTRKVA